MSVGRRAHFAQPRPDLSPVRPILALPSPVVELHQSPVYPGSETGRSVIYSRHIKAALCAIKVRQTPESR